MEQTTNAEAGPVERPVRPAHERAAFARWCRENGHGELDDMLTPLDRSLRALMWPVWLGAVAAERERCLRILRSVNNSDNAMTANDCADLIASGRECF